VFYRPIRQVVNISYILQKQITAMSSFAGVFHKQGRRQDLDEGAEAPSPGSWSPLPRNDKRGPVDLRQWGPLYDSASTLISSLKLLLSSWLDLLQKWDNFPLVWVPLPSSFLCIQAFLKPAKTAKHELQQKRKTMHFFNDYLFCYN